MAWGFDAVSGAVATAGATSVSWSHTIGSGSNRMLSIDAAIERDNPAPTVSSATYNSVTSTAIRNDVAVGASFSNRSDIRYLLEANLPSTGVYTVVVNASGGCDELIGEASSYTGIAQQAPEANNGNNNTAGTSVSATLSTITNNALLIAAGASNNNQNHTPGNGLAERRQDAGSFSGSTLSSNDKNVPTAGSTTGSFSVPTSGRLAISMAAFKEFVAGGANWLKQGYWWNETYGHVGGHK